jgi:hypothetical protein
MGFWRFDVRTRATIAAALAIATLMAASPPDTAVIVDSGSTNANGYTIHIASDGNASVTYQPRGGSPIGAPKHFTVPAATTARFFSDLEAARKGNVATVPCMKPVSFGTTLKVTWQGWTSPDLTCPPKDALGETLVSDVAAIRKAGGVDPLSPHP